MILFESDTPSRTHGIPSSGSLEYGKRLPSRGHNFGTYSDLGSLIGRTHVHSSVRQVVVTAYESLESTYPEGHFIYAESGWPRGGSFRPHRTHRSGLSVDFVVPVLSGGEPDTLMCWAANTWCYGVSFDEKGRREGDPDQRIDFDAIAAHLLALDASARAHGARIQRVIFAPDLRRALFRAKGGDQVRAKIRFMKKRAWVRHDDHYHVDFALRDRSQ